MAALTPEDVRRYRDQAFAKPRNDGARPIHGYSRNLQGGTKGSSLDEHYARQNGAPSRSDGTAFAGTTAEDVSADMAAHGERTGFGGVGKEPARNLSPRERALLNPGSIPPVPSVPAPPDPFGTGHMPLTQDNPFIAALRQSVADSTPPPSQPQSQPLRPATDPSTVRQPTPPVGPPTDAAGNPASDSNPVANTPADYRQMASDARTGRTVTTAGATGLTPSANGGMQQAADFRRQISSAYGTGSNTTRVPGQGPAITTDSLGRPVKLRENLDERKAIQASRDQPSEDEEEAV